MNKTLSELGTRTGMQRRSDPISVSFKWAFTNIVIGDKEPRFVLQGFRFLTEHSHMDAFNYVAEARYSSTVAQKSVCMLLSLADT